MRDILWRSAMINKLKRKFIILATVSILLLMTVLVGVMNLINYSVVVKESDAVLDVLALPDNPFFNKGDHPEKPALSGSSAMRKWKETARRGYSSSIADASSIRFIRSCEQAFASDFLGALLFL